MAMAKDHQGSDCINLVSQKNMEMLTPLTPSFAANGLISNPSQANEHLHLKQKGLGLAQR